MALALIVSGIVFGTIAVGARASSLTVATGPASAVTTTTAQLTGALQAPGLTQAVFEFGTSPRLGARSSRVTVHARGRMRVVARVGRLRPGTRYFYRLIIAKCAACRATVGGVGTFTTAVPLPVVVAAAATGIGQTTAALTGKVDPEGFATSYRFQYGTTTHYGAVTAKRSAGASAKTLLAAVAVTALARATTYHYRLVATSRGGTRYGADRTFTTNGFYTNPVYSGAMPDPYVLDVGDTHSDYWAFGTGNRFLVLHSTNLVNWTQEPDAFQRKPSWVVQSGDWHPWAPSVVQSRQACPGTRSSECFVMFYVGLSAVYHVNCVAVATSTTPGGPYVDHGPLAPTHLTTLLATLLGSAPAMPLGCGDALGKSNIDPSPFIAPSGQAYLYVSTDDACTVGVCSFAPTISVIPLSSDLLTVSGARIPLFAGQAGSWEDEGVSAPTVEGPSMELHDGTYYLFYSGGSYVSHYAMGYATGPTPVGPFIQAPANPIFRATATALAPGGGDDFVTGPHGATWMIYSARLGSVKATRSLWIDPVTWEPSSTLGAPETPLIAGPTTTPQGIDP